MENRRKNAKEWQRHFEQNYDEVETVITHKAGIETRGSGGRKKRIAGIETDTELHDCHTLHLSRRFRERKYTVKIFVVQWLKNIP